MYTHKQQTQEQAWPKNAERWFLEWAMSFDAWLDTPDGVAWLEDQEAMDSERRNAQPWEDRQADLSGWKS